MIIKLETRKEWDPHASSFQCLDKPSSHEDTLEDEILLPFPFTNRYVVQRRCYTNNRDNPQLFEKIGCVKTTNKAWIILMEPLEEGSYPTKEGLVRAESASVTLIEELSEKPKRVAIKMTSEVNLKGKIPGWLLQLTVSKDQARGMRRFISAYRENFAPKSQEEKR